MSARKIIDQLKELSTKERKKTNEWFFKTGKGEYSEFDKFIGVTMPNIRKVAKKHYQNISNIELAKVTNHSIHEVRLCGFIITVYKYQQKDSDKHSIYSFYLNNLGSVNNWDIVDSSAPHILGDYMTQNLTKLNYLMSYLNLTIYGKGGFQLLQLYHLLRRIPLRQLLELLKNYWVISKT